MKKWRMFSFSLLLLLFLIPGLCSAQAPPTIAQSLADEGIGTSHEELLKALRSPTPKIRGMAAGQLAENGDKDAIPALNRALRDERNATERLNIARALAYLGDPRGASAMAKLCADESVPTDLRLTAAGELQEHGNERCFTSVAKILSSTDVPPMTFAALDYLKRSHVELVPASDLYRFVALGLKAALRSEDPMVRQRTADCIARYHMTAAKSDLQAAAEKESDPKARAAMESAERALSR